MRHTSTVLAVPSQADTQLSPMRLTRAPHLSNHHPYASDGRTRELLMHASLSRKRFLLSKPILTDFDRLFASTREKYGPYFSVENMENKFGNTFSK